MPEPIASESTGASGSPRPERPNAMRLRWTDPQEAEREFERLRGQLAEQIERDDLTEARQTAAAMIRIKPEDSDALEAFTYLDQALTEAEAPQKAAPVELARELRCLAGHPTGILTLAASPDGRLLISAASENTMASGRTEAGDALTFRVWDVASGKEVRKLRGHTSVTTSLVYGSGGRYILTGNRG